MDRARRRGGRWRRSRLPPRASLRAIELDGRLADKLKSGQEMIVNLSGLVVAARPGGRDRKQPIERFSDMTSLESYSGEGKSRPASPLLLLLAIACFGMALLGGCAVDPGLKGSRYAVSAASAQFYKNGPAQAVGFESSSTIPMPDLGPDFALPRGAAVTLLKRELGYSKVVSDEGVTGWIANDQMRPAPALVRDAPVRNSPATNIVPRKRTPSSAPAVEQKLDLTDILLPLPS